MEPFDFLVVGGGIAGLSAVVRLSQSGSVLCCTKEGLAESNTAYAQGGIAVAMGGDEDVALHLEDTLMAGDGLVDRVAARMLVEQGPQRVEELLTWGTEFDRYTAGEHAGELMRTREGAHSLSRILHANGDATGREIALSLLRHVKSLANVTLMEWTTSVELTVEEGRVVGATLLDGEGGLLNVRVRAVLLATGGAGQVYSDTTNPAVATGDGIALAYRAGAALEDMEFYQFHPTAFAQEGAPRFLLSEALRGEGALLLNAAGERFMPRYHPLLELAPRDVVARAITREALAGPVYLDMRASTIDLHQRFPGISKFLAGYGLDLKRDLIPVGPAAHYLMGGIKTDVQGRTTLPGLYAAGEAACTGVHGANRLASNSLLEGLVFGALAAEAMASDKLPTLQSELAAPAQILEAAVVTDEAAVEAWIAELRALMWRDAGLLRDGEGLRRAKVRLAEMAQTCPHGMTRREIEARNLLTVATVMVECALAREESRGAHFRSDFPEHKPVAVHTVIERGRVTEIQS
ncbi:L-aspartate oxidase [Granulicella sp. WH15]|uniref:L-aspartate oxidase n=1 Tax=Granulicella sp. WH15 TaxID=2602070 RepID=UPI00136721DE|nr:L-aspartate oxidase [Granulicella sp. WH15]QHN04877.1 L-aspartate oxidase [Granulicella sp. WH15]